METQTVEFTHRQRQVIRCLAHGMSNEAGAAALDITPRTFKHHVDAMRNKLARAGHDTPGRRQLPAVYHELTGENPLV